MATIISPNKPQEDDFGWDDVDPKLLAHILDEVFGDTDPSLAGNSYLHDEQRLAAAFEATFESLVSPFLPTANTTNSNQTDHTSDPHVDGTQADNIAALHNGLTDCNEKLLQMEGALREFHERILDVCTEIEGIRAEAVGARAARDMKRSLQRHISTLLELLVIPPDVVHLLLMTTEYQSHQRGAIGIGGGGVMSAGGEELSPQFLLAMRRLHALIRKRIANQDVVLGRLAMPFSGAIAAEKEKQDQASAGTTSHASTVVVKLFQCQAFREMVGTTEDLIIFVCMRIRAFFEPRLSALENPRTNSVAQQENVLRQFRQLVRFMQDACAYLKMTLAIRPSQQHEEPPQRGGAVAPTGLVQHKPFIPFRIVKALYDDLKVQYQTVLSRVYTGRVGRYITALTDMEVGYGLGGEGGAGNAPIAQSVASSVVGGLASLFWGSTTTAGSAAGASAGPSQHDHQAAHRQITRPPLLGDRCTIGPYAGAGGGMHVSAAAAAASAASAMMAGAGPHGVAEDLTPFSLGLRVNLFRGDDAAGLSSSVGRGSDYASPPTTAYLAAGASTPSSTHTSMAGTIRGVGLLHRANINPTYVPVLGVADPQEDAGIFRTPTIPHISRMKKQYHTYEETFRSLNHIVSDTVSHEYLFLLDFFGADSWQMCNEIFRKTLQHIVDHVCDKVLLNTPRVDLVQQHGAGGSSAASTSAATGLNAAFSPFVSGNKDLGGLLILFRMTLTFRVQMLHVRQLYILEPYYNSLLTLLWPAVHAALEDHMRSLRACASLASDRCSMFAAGGARGGPALSSPAPPEPMTIASVHPLALRYAEMSSMLLQLADLSFVTHYKHLRIFESIARNLGGHQGRRSSPAALSLSAGRSQSVCSTTDDGVLSAAAVQQHATAASCEDDESLEIGSWLSVLRTNFSVMRIEVCRLLSLHCKMYVDGCNASLRRRLADEHAATTMTNSNGSNAHSSDAFGVAAVPPVEERRWMAACVPVTISLYHIVSTWEQRLASAKERALLSQQYDVAQLDVLFSANSLELTAAANGLYDLGMSLPTGLRREWERSHARLAPDTAGSLSVYSTHNHSSATSPTAAKVGDYPPQAQTADEYPAALPPPSTVLSAVDMQMIFSLVRNSDYQVVKRLAASHVQQLARVVVAVACPALNHLASLITAFDDEVLAEDLLLLGVQFDEEDVEALGATDDCSLHSPWQNAVAKGPSGAGQQLRYESAERETTGGQGSATESPFYHRNALLLPMEHHVTASDERIKVGSASSLGEEWEGRDAVGAADDETFSHAVDTTPMFIRIARLVKYCTVILTRCTHFATSWMADIQTLRRLVREYIGHAELQRIVLVRACALLICANQQLHDQLTVVVDIINRLHGRSRRLADAFEYPPAAGGGSFLPLPPVITTIKGLVVPNQQLIDHLRTFATLGSAHHDPHPDL